MKRLNNPNYPVRRQPAGRTVAGVLTVLLLLLFAACGGTTLPESTDTEPPPATEALLADQSAPEALPTELPAPTQAPPTEVPPTEAPPTEAPPEPTEEPAAEPSANVATGNCANPFLPVVDGRTLVYQSADPLSGTTNTYSITYGLTGDGGFNATFAMEGQPEPFTLEWVCTDEGLLSPNLSTMLAETAGIEVEVLEASGVTLPTADEMAVGATWTTTYVMQLIFTDETIGSMTMNQSIANTSEIVGAESITVPYGTFDALRVESSGTVEMSMELEGTPMPAPGVNITSTTWYVEDIGMVREETPDLLGTGAGPTITELVDVIEAP